MVANLITGTGLEARMLPRLDDDSREFWTGGASGRLRLPRCQDCGRWLFPPAGTCSACGGRAPYEALSGRGTVFTFTVNHHAFNPAVAVPYVIAVVELEEQRDLRFTTNIVNCGLASVAVGMRVRVVFEPHDEIFVPLFEPDT